MAASESRVAEADRSFELLYRAHRRDVYNFVLHDVRNPDEAEEVTQVAFLNAYRALRRGRPPEKPRAWLLTIAQNVSRRRFRRSSARIREVPLDTELTVAAPDDYDGPTADEICAAFRLLPDNQRSALAMRELQGRSYAEIADELDLTIPAVETLIFRARRAVRKQLELEGGKLRGLLLGPLALPGLIAKAVGSVTGSVGRVGLGAKTAGLAGALVVGAGAIEFVPPILAAEDPPAVEEIAPMKALGPTFVAEPGPAAATGADKTKAAKATKGPASTKGGAAKNETSAGNLPNLPGEAPPALPPAHVPPVNVPAPPVVVVPPIDVPQVPPPPAVVVPPIEVPDLPVPPLPPVQPPDLP